MALNSAWGTQEELIGEGVYPLMNSYKNGSEEQGSQHSTVSNRHQNTLKMNCFKLLLVVFAIVLIGAVMGQEEDHHEHDHHDHGNSHVHLSQKHKHGEHKFTYDIKHGKHSHTWHGSAYPHGYGGLGA